MSNYTPPKNILPIFNPAEFNQPATTSGTSIITPAYLEENYLQYPTAQGTETLIDVNVNGIATFTDTTLFTGVSNTIQNYLYVATEGVDAPTILTSGGTFGWVDGFGLNIYGFGSTPTNGGVNLIAGETDVFSALYDSIVSYVPHTMINSLIVSNGMNFGSGTQTISNIQTGQYFTNTAVNNQSGTGSNQVDVSISYGYTFANIPCVTATLINDATLGSANTLVVSLVSISETGFILNVMNAKYGGTGTDGANWGINWIAIG